MKNCKSPRSAMCCLVVLTSPGWALAQWSGSFGASGPNDVVNTLAVASPAPGTSVRLYAGGNFTSVTTATGTIPAPYIASWDGQSWVQGPGLSGTVSHLAVHPFGGTPTLFAAKNSGGSGGPLGRLTNGQWSELPAGSQFWLHGLASYDLGQGPRLALSSAFVPPYEYIAAWNNGALETMGSGLISVTKAFAMYDDGQGPRFYAGMGANAHPGLSFLSRFDGVEWTMPAGSPNSPINAMTVYDDGTGPALYVGGDFVVLTSGLNVSHIARFKNGAWSALGTGVNSSVKSMAVFDDGAGPALYIGGDFTVAGGQPASRIARWRAGQWSALDAGITGGSVLALAVFDDDGPGPLRPALYAAGAFTSAGGFPALHIARWGEVTPCYANCDGSATEPRLNANDFQCFLNQFAGGDAYANCDGSTATPLLNANDFQCFLNSFANGCP